MIVYREFSSLSTDLGFSRKALYGVSYNTSRHYRPVSIPKGNGDFRQLHVPDDFLKAIQKQIACKLLPLEEISPYATAYRPGGSTKINAAIHIGKPVVVKLDIRHFFDHILYSMVKEKAFPAERYSESNRILLSILCVYNDCLPQGAPTSPAISNIIMKDFDNAIGKWCVERGINYTRYCDDMTFSGDFEPSSLISCVRTELKKLGFFLNDKKTTIVRQGQRQQITGIVVNKKLDIPSDYKRKIRQEIYYCEKFGVPSHLEITAPDKSEKEYLACLLGRINYVLSVERQNSLFKRYKATVQGFIKTLSEGDAS